ncbi:MAG: sensor histidine kinase [Phaeodactylibacter sp.]|uniref:tetratricopeptide repeat-containing sensor histidine kinase n=1 Tax=Phaeodactylibacter sp. TaxID=1940289 RepID=UPI0032EBC3FF
MSSKYNQANLLTRLENYRRAEKSYKELLDITDNPVVHGVVFSSLGILNMKQGRHSEALDFLLKSKALIDYASEPELTYLNLGIAYMKLERHQLAEDALAQAAAICKERGLKRSFLLVWNNFVKLYYRSGDLGRAREFLDLAEDQVAPSNLTEQAVIYEMKAKIYEEEKDWENALAFLKLKQIYMDSIESMEKLEAITEIETKYQTEKKELEIQTLQRKKELQAQINRNQRLGLGGLSLGLIILTGLSAFLYRQRQRIQAQKFEIELLHGEQRHRMMNNLVFANSLMSLQVRRLEEQPEAQQAVREAEGRLNAMSALHRRLHHDGEGQKSIAIHDYLQEVTHALQRSFSSPEHPVAIQLHCPEQEQVDGDAAMRIGLIVNELATNSCKHAFAEQPNPEINVELQPETEGHYRLIYTDNGSGLPADFQVDTKQSMGLFLIHNLVKQLNGRIAFSGEKGTRVECELNLKAA